MRPALRLATVVAEAAFAVDIGCFVVTGVTVKIFPRSNDPNITDEIIPLLALAIFVALTTWISFRQLRSCYTKRETRALTIAVAVFVPLSMVISLSLAPLAGWIPNVISLNRYGLLAALVLTVGATTTLLAFAACALVLWVTRLTVKAEQYD